MNVTINKKILATAICAVAMGIYSSFAYTVDDNSVIFSHEGMTTQITVMSDEIVHVKKRLESSGEEQLKDYVVTMEPQKVDWDVVERGGKLAISTPKISAIVDKQGVVTFYDCSGKQILSEMAGGSIIEPIDKYDNRVTQSFEVGDEALYGLGQFQNGLMNWKNTPIQIRQFNQEIANPVVISTNGYGIYWHNYSVTEFNHPDNTLNLENIVDEKEKIKSGKFTPAKSGTHYFYIESPTFKPGKNRQFGATRLIIERDTVISYDTMWFPDAFSGRKYLEAGKEYDVVFQDTGAQVDARLSYNEPDYNKTQFDSSHGESISYYFIYGENPDKVLNAYGKLTGTPPMLPKKGYGFWHSRDTYHSAEQLMRNAKGYRERQIPIDIYVQDHAYWPSAKSPEWDRTRYPNPESMVTELKDMNMDLIVSVWPTVQSKPHQERYELDMLSNKSSFVDAYDPAVRDRFYSMLSDSMFHFGVKGIWLDGSEPILDPEPMSLTAGGEYCKVSNIYGTMVSRAVYEGRRAEFPSERVMNLTRSGFAGHQRYSSVLWSGDVDGTWKQYREQIAAGLNLTMTGLPYWTTDIGGYFREKVGANSVIQNHLTSPSYIEMLARWFQYGAFCPIFRIHGHDYVTEVWKFGEEFEKAARKFIDLRYQLMPYIYSTAWDMSNDGSAMMSPLASGYPEDKRVWEIWDQYMFGESLMVCPVVEYGMREREVYLPEGDWYDFWTNNMIPGDEVITAAAPFDSMPIYVKAGSIIPFGPKVQYATEQTDELTTLRIYAGTDSSYTLYLDDNESYNYENGEYSVIEMNYNDNDRTLTLTTPHDKYIDFNSNPMSFKVEIIGYKEIKELKFSGVSQTIKL
ncbi:MAG: glycoside hydrolase family 31 protein [Rikenellaceae bacterium]